MNATIPERLHIQYTRAPSMAGRERLLSRSGEPLFFAAWERALMMHFEVDAKALQRDVPYELDLWDGRAFVSLVAFTMRGMRPRIGGKLAAMLFRPIATNDFLNVRTYVRHGKDGEPGIHFLTEWLSSRLAVMLGPPVFGLPYRHGNICYEHDWHREEMRGSVIDTSGRGQLVYEATAMKPLEFFPCASGSRDEWLMERYTAFNSAGGWNRFFRVWHPPWPQQEVSVNFEDLSLLVNRWPWFRDARFVGANFSPGFDSVWMSRPHRVKML